MPTGTAQSSRRPAARTACTSVEICAVKKKKKAKRKEVLIGKQKLSKQATLNKQTQARGTWVKARRVVGGCLKLCVLRVGSCKMGSSTLDSGGGCRGASGQNGAPAPFRKNALAFNYGGWAPPLSPRDPSHTPPRPLRNRSQEWRATRQNCANIFLGHVTEDDGVVFLGIMLGIYTFKIPKSSFRNASSRWKTLM